MNAAHHGALLSVIAVSAALTACSTAIPPPVQRSPAALRTPPTAPGETSFDARGPVLHGFVVDPARDRRGGERSSVSSDLHERCDVPTVYFEFDAVTPSREDKAELARVARCFRDGPLHDRKLHLIGRADLTGDPSYNMALGLRRANHVKRELVRAGVPASRILATSRGTTAFLGPFDGYTYADDRRVDIVVMQ